MKACVVIVLHFGLAGTETEHQHLSLDTGFGVVLEGGAHLEVLRDGISESLIERPPPVLDQKI